MAEVTRPQPRRITALFTVAFVVVVAVHAGLHLDLAAEDTATVQPPRQSTVCLDCHEGLAEGLAHTAHQLASDPDQPDAWVACTDCHAGNPRHYEEDPEAYPMANPADLSAAAVAEICSACHLTSHQQNMAEDNVHFENNVSCSGCHSVHEGEALGMLHQSQTDLCYTCHPAVEGEFAQPFRHPVNDHIVECSGCHMTLDRTSRELSLNGTNVCTTCHTEFQGPFPFEHQASVDYSTEEGACITCHAPHGSLLPRMLTQPYEAPAYQLCSQCHATPPGHAFSFKHGSKWDNISCNECHTDIHGSYTNRYFLRETLRGEGCLNSSCHGS